MEQPTTTPEDRLREFQSLVNMAPYKPLPSAPSWLAVLGRSAETDFGAQALLGPNGVSVATQTEQRLRAMPDAASLFMAVLASRMRGTGRMLAVGLPPSARHLPLLLASSVILANTIDQSLQERPVVGGGVLVVSPDLDVRSFPTAGECRCGHGQAKLSSPESASSYLAWSFPDALSSDQI